MVAGSSRAGKGQSWYGDGLRFTCTRCSRCCTGPPGYVWVSDAEAGRIAAFLGLELAEFRAHHCRRAWFRVSLTEKDNGDCAFLTPDGCGIYEVRPTQCRTFPFWEHNVASRRRWEAVADRCPGVGRGRLYSRDEIDRILDGGTST